MKYASSFKNAYENLFDPNQIRASAMLTQQSGDSISDIATAAMMLGDDVDTSRQFKMMFDKMNLLDTEMRANKYIFNKAEEYKKLRTAGNEQAIVSWIRNQGEEFDKYLSHIRNTNDEFTDTLWRIAKENPAYFNPMKEVFAKTNGDVDTIFKLKKYDLIIHAAAYQGAGDFTVKYPADQFFKNNLIHTNTLECWKRHQPVAKLIGIGSSCSYPGDIEDISEEDFFTGPLHPSVETYGLT